MTSKAMVWAVGAIVVVAAILLIGRAGSGTYGPDATSTAATTTAGNGAGNAAGGGYGNGGNGGGVGTTTQPRTTTLAIGAEGGAGGVIIKPTSVVEDSRCPASVECVWAGTFRANVMLTTNGGTLSRTIELGKPEEIPGGQTVTLTAVTPAAIAGGTAKVETYRLTFLVETK